MIITLFFFSIWFYALEMTGFFFGWYDQIVLIGTSIFEYIHDDDRKEFAEKLEIHHIDAESSSMTDCPSGTTYGFYFQKKLNFQTGIIITHLLYCRKPVSNKQYKQQQVNWLYRKVQVDFTQTYVSE